MENIEQLSDEKVSDEQILQALQTAAGFAETVVKRLWCLTLGKTAKELFGEEMADHIGVIKIDAKEGSGDPTFFLNLDLVDSSYRVDMEQFKKIPIAYNEMTRLFSSLDIYWDYCKKNYGLPDLHIWKTIWATAHIAGAPPDSQHIGIIAKKIMPL
jgi:dihydrofolate reductase